jgi:outer membrane receptor protein involved in Fe transport
MVRAATVIVVLCALSCPVPRPAAAVGSIDSLPGRSATPEETLTVWDGVPPSPVRMALSPFVRVIDREDIRRSLATNLEDLLIESGWVYGRRRGPLGGGTSLHYLGHPGRHLVVLRDGEPWNDPTGGSAGLSLVPLSTVERVELLDGPAAALHARGGGAGVINVVTRQEVEPEARVETEVSDGRDNTGVRRVSFQTPRSGLVVRTFYDEIETRGYPYDAGGDPAFNDAHFFSKNLSWELHTQVTRTAKLLSRLERYEEHFDGRLGLPAGGLERSGARASLEMLDRSGRRVRLFHSMRREGTSGESARAIRLGVMVEGGWEIGSEFLLHLAAEGGRTTSEIENDLGSARPRRKDVRARVLLVDRGERRLRRSAWLGTYADNLVGADLTGGAAAAWAPSDGWLLKASLFREVIPVSLDRVGGPPLAADGVASVDPADDVEPEELLGLRAGLGFRREALDVSLGYFYTEVDNPVAPVADDGIPAGPSTPSPRFGNLWANRIAARGLSARGRFRFPAGPFAARLDLDGYRSVSPDAGLPRWNGDATIEADVSLFAGTTEGRLRWELHGAEGPEHFTDYLVHDASVSFLIRDVKLYAVLTNVFDRTYTRVDDFLLPPRTWVLGVTWDFSN